MSSFKTLGFLAIVLVTFDKVCAMGRQDNPTFDTELQIALLPTPGGSPHGSEDGDLLITTQPGRSGELPVPANAMQKKDYFNACPKPLKDCFGLCNAGGKKINTFLEENPVSRDVIEAGLFTGASVVASNWGRGEVFPVVFQHLAGKSIRKLMGHLKMPLPVNLGIISGAAYGFYHLDTETYPTQPLTSALVTNATSTDDPYGYAPDDQWEYDPKNGFESGMAKVMVLAGADFVRNYFKDRAHAHQD